MMKRAGGARCQWLLHTAPRPASKLQTACGGGGLMRPSLSDLQTIHLKLISVTLYVCH